MGDYGLPAAARYGPGATRRYGSMAPDIGLGDTTSSDTTPTASPVVTPVAPGPSHSPGVESVSGSIPDDVLVEDLIWGVGG